MFLNGLIVNSVSEAKIKMEQLKITSVTLIGKHWHLEFLPPTFLFLSFFGVIITFKVRQHFQNTG